MKQMTKLLQQAYERAAALPQEDQDRFARFLLSELESEERWAELFSRPESEELLEKVADEALSLHRQGTVEDRYGALADGKPSFSKSEEREAARKARASRYADKSQSPLA